MQIKIIMNKMAKPLVAKDLKKYARQKEVLNYRPTGETANRRSNYLWNTLRAAKK